MVLIRRLPDGLKGNPVQFGSCPRSCKLFKSLLKTSPLSGNCQMGRLKRLSKPEDLPLYALIVAFGWKGEE